MTQPKKEKNKTYQQLWEEIKKKKKCSIQLAVDSDALFKRVKNAVIKQKCNDLAFKFGLEDKRAKLEIDRKGSIMTFKLVVGIGQEDI